MRTKRGPKGLLSMAKSCYLVLIAVTGITEVSHKEVNAGERKNPNLLSADSLHLTQSVPFVRLWTSYVSKNLGTGKWRYFGRKVLGGSIVGGGVIVAGPTVIVAAVRILIRKLRNPGPGLSPEPLLPVPAVP